MLRAAVLICVAAFVTGCERDVPAMGWPGTIDTLASGTVVIRNPADGLWTDEETWRLHERFRIGSLTGNAADVFGDIRDVELGPDGAIHVLDGQASEVRVFRPDGTHALTFGRSGAGPGELRRPTGLAFDSHGVLWVNNWGNARYSGFDPHTGDVVREEQRHASYAVLPWPGRFDDADRLLDTALGTDGDPVILRLDTAFALQDTLPMPELGDEHRVTFLRDGVPVMSMTMPYAPQPAWTPHPDGGILVGEGAEYRLHHIEFDGDTLRTIEVAHTPLPVTAAERDSALALFEERSRAAGGQPNRSPRVPEYRPPHGSILVDDARHIWVRRPAPTDSTSNWDVIGPDARLLGTVELPVMPAYMGLVVRGDRVAVATTIDDVPTVIVYDIVRGGS